MHPCRRVPQQRLARSADGVAEVSALSTSCDCFSEAGIAEETRFCRHAAFHCSRREVTIGGQNFATAADATAAVGNSCQTRRLNELDDFKAEDFVDTGKIAVQSCLRSLLYLDAMVFHQDQLHRFEREEHHNFPLAQACRLRIVSHRAAFPWEYFVVACSELVMNNSCRQS